MNFQSSAVSVCKALLKFTDQYISELILLYFSMLHLIGMYDIFKYGPFKSKDYFIRKKMVQTVHDSSSVAFYRINYDGGLLFRKFKLHSLSKDLHTSK